MASAELVEALRGYEDYIARNGIDDDVIDAYLMATDAAYGGDDIGYALTVSARCKEIIEQKVALDTGGGTVWDLEKYLFETHNTYDLVEKY